MKQCYALYVLLYYCVLMVRDFQMLTKQQFGKQFNQQLVHGFVVVENETYISVLITHL